MKNKFTNMAKLTIRAAFIIFFLSYKSLFAAQIIEVTNDAEIKAEISSYELNRIKIEGGKIAGFRALEGDLSAVSDTKNGELFIHLPRRYSRKITNLFIISDSGATFKLLLVPKNIPAEQIFLVERSSSDKNLQISDQYRDNIISFYKDIYAQKPIKDYHILAKKKRVKKDGLKITKIITYEPKGKSGLHGEILEVKNKSKEVKIISPQDFFKNGVRAIKLDSHILEVGQTTKLYIISING